MKIFTTLTKDIIYQIISFFFQNWYNSWYYPGSNYPKAQSESNSTFGSEEKSLVISLPHVYVSKEGIVLGIPYSW